MIQLAMLLLAASPESVGREIYWRSRASGVEIEAWLNRGETRVGAAAFACVNCHGVFGEGGAETGLKIPAIAGAGQRSRSAFARAVQSGLRSDGSPLHSAMPLYKLADDQLDALWSYLAIIGGPRDPVRGVTAYTVRIGVLSAPVRNAEIQDILQAAAQVENARGGFYGRKMELVEKSTVAELAAANVLAILAPSPIEWTSERGNLVEREEIPMVAAWQFRTPLNEWAFSLLPSNASQWGALVAILAQQATKPKRIALVQENGFLDAAARKQIETAVEAYKLEWTSSEDSADIVLFAGRPDTFPKVLAQPRASLIGTLAVFGGGVQPSKNTRVLLASGFPAPDQQRWGSLPALLGHRFTGSPFQALALAAFRAAAETLRSPYSARPHPRLFRAGLERISQLETGVTAPLTFSQAQHETAGGSYILERGSDSAIRTLAGPLQSQPQSRPALAGGLRQ